MIATLVRLDRRLARKLRFHRAEERGIVLPLTAIMMVLLLAFTAFAVDLGILYSERRQDQSAVDNGALSGGRVMIGNGSPEDVFSDIASVTYANMGTPSFDEDTWWSMIAGVNGEENCLDDDAVGEGFPDPLELSGSISAPGGATIPAGTVVECINFDDADNPSRLRVHLPMIQVEAIFAQVVGINGYESSAFAEVGVSNPRDIGGVLPFAIAAASTGLSEVCLKADSQSEYEGCDSGTTGNYGRLDLSVFGFLNAPEDCAGTGNADDPLAINTAQGLDHYLALSPTATPSPIYTDASECTGAKDDDPNEAETQTGNAANGFNAGLIGFDGESVGSVDLPTGLQGRLMGINPKLDASYQPGVTNTIKVSNDDRFIEDVPLWQFLTQDCEDEPLLPGCLEPGTPSGTTVPIRCLPGTFAVLTQAELEAYLNTFPGLTSATYGSWTTPGQIAESLTYTGPGGTWNGATTEHMNACFDDYNDGILVPPFAGGSPYTATMFAKDTITGDNYVDDDGVQHTVYDIEYSHRFAWMPVIWDETFPNGSSAVHFKEFKPVFVNRTFGKCTGNPKVCDFQHSPGEAIDGVLMSGADMGAASAMAITMTMLPVDVQEAQQKKLLDDPPVRLMR